MQNHKAIELSLEVEKITPIKEVNLIVEKEKHLTVSEIQELYQDVNKPQDWQINVNSYKLIDKIIELWFEKQGYDFWINPYPEVTQWELLKDNEILFKYVEN